MQPILLCLLCMSVIGEGFRVTLQGGNDTLGQEGMVVLQGVRPDQEDTLDHSDMLDIGMCSKGGHGTTDADDRVAVLICRELGFEDGHAIHSEEGQDSHPKNMLFESGWECTGEEETVSECAFESALVELGECENGSYLRVNCMDINDQLSARVQKKVSYTDFQGPGSTYMGKVGITAYKNYESLKHKNAWFSDHILGFVEGELNNGAHYYVQSAYTNAYSSATGITDLSRVKIDGKGKRNAFICMQALGLTSFDVCIAKASQTDGWYAYVWSPKFKDEYVSRKRYNDLRYVRIYVKAYDTSSENKIRAIWYFYNSQGKYIGREIKYFSRSLGSYFKSSNSKPYVRFGRFMSLVPKHGYSDSSDGSYLMNGNLYGLRLYKGSWVDFDMSKIDYAWSVQGANILSLDISPSSSPSRDEINLIHRYDLH